MKPTWIRLATITLVAASTAFSFVNADEKTVKLADCPEAVRKTIEHEAKGAKIASVTESTEDDGTEFSTEAKIGERTYEIRVDTEGTLLEMSLMVDDDEVKFSDAPAAVRETLLKESGGAKFEDLEKDIKYGVVVFNAVVPIKGKEYSFVVAANGTLIEKSLVIIEDDIDLSHCPAPVQKAFKEHAHDGKIGQITRSTGVSGHVFEADIEIGDKTYFVEVTEGGSLISKSLVEEDE